MALRSDLQNKIERIRDYLYGGGYPDPVSNAEQLSFLFFFYLLEVFDQQNVEVAQYTKRPYVSYFAGEWTLRNPLNAPKAGQKTIPAERLKWSSWAKHLKGEPLVRFVRDEVFPFFQTIGERGGTNFMDGARLDIGDPAVLSQVVDLVDQLDLNHEDADTKGDLFEHILKQIRQAGELGQFRTPRHIIRMIISLVDPKIGETVYDPAAGTAGFLVAAYEHIQLANSDPATVIEVERDGKIVRRGHGDLLDDAQWN